MEARSRITTLPRQAVLAIAVALLVTFALAGGYAIRFATAPAAAPTHSTTVWSAGGSSASGTDPGCVVVGGHRGC